MMYRAIFLSTALICSLAQSGFCQSKNVSPVFAKGCEQMMQKNFSAALLSFSEAISNEPNDPNAYFRRGQSFFCMSNYKEAVLDFERAIANGGLDANAFLWRGTAYARLENDELAIRDYEKAMRLNPKLVENYQSAAADSKLVPLTTSQTPGKASDTVNLGNNQRAMDDYSTAVKNVSANLIGYFRPGTAYSGILNISGELIPVAGLNDRSEWIKGKQHSRDFLTLKNPGRDMNDLDTQINAHPADANLYFQRGRVFQQMGDPDKTLSDFTRAIDLDKKNAHYYLARAFYYFQQNKPDLAELDIHKAQDIDPIVPVEMSFDAPKVKARTTKS